IDARIADADARPLSLVLVDVVKRKVAHRVELGTIAPGGWRPHLTAAEDANAVDVDFTSTTSDRDEQRVDFETGARSPKPPEAPPPAAVTPAAPPPFATTHARVEVRGAGVLWTGPQGTVAYRLDRRPSSVRWPAGDCDVQLSPRGLRTLRLCSEGGHRGFAGGEVASLLGGPRR